MLAKQMRRSALLSGRNVHCPRRMLSPGESWWVFSRYRQTYGQTDGRQTVTLRFPPHACYCYYALSS